MEVDGSTEEETLDFSLCIICQFNSEEKLVEQPSSYEKPLTFLKEWARYGESKYCKAWAKLQCFSPEDLEEKKATWHRSCYKDVVHSGMLKRAKDRYEKQLEGGQHAKKRRTSEQVLTEVPTLTRSKTTPFYKSVCFFCGDSARYQQPLHNVSTSSAGESLQAAIQATNDDRLRVKLSTAIDPTDGHAMDIKYHKKCWLTYVVNAPRKRLSTSTNNCNQRACSIAAQVEFLTMLDNSLNAGDILTMAELEIAYENILEENNFADPSCSRKTLKQLIQREIPGVEFHRPRKANESERLSIKRTRDEAIELSHNADQYDDDDDVKTLFNAARILRKLINKCKHWEFVGTFNDLTSEHLPPEVYSFCRWLIQGTNVKVSGGEKSDVVHKRVISLAQTVVSSCLTERQMYNKKSEDIKSGREMPQQLAVGLALRQAIRSKEIVNMLHGFGMSVEYNRLLRVEAQIEESVINRIQENNGIYLPPDFVKDRHLFYAVDNSDFSEDTPDGKRTLHGTAMAIYQQIENGDGTAEIRLDRTLQKKRTVGEIPESLTNVLECEEPPKKPKNPVYQHFSLFEDDELPITVRYEDFGWLLGRSLSRTCTHNDDEDKTSCVPVWAAYNSILHDAMKPTRSATPPLIPAPAHEWSTLLTIFKQAQNINTTIVGPNRKTVITLDLGLYQPAKQLQMARRDLDHIILRPGELHIVMAQLRAIGSYIDSSGIDLCWIESQLYGPSTVKQIIEGKHVRRGEVAHLITLEALFHMYLEAFYQCNNETPASLKEVADTLNKACKEGEKDKIRSANSSMIDTIKTSKVLEKMSDFDKAHEKNPLFQVMRQYMSMVMEMLAFIRAVRTGDWELHLRALEKFTRYFFAHDMINYARMMPVYIAEMEGLKSTDPDLIKEFQQGNWVVNKNREVSFCALGADHALEHVNRSMKVSGGLVGITLNANARDKFFLIAPELARLAKEAKSMAGVHQKKQVHHHCLSKAVLTREEKNIEQLKSTIKRFTNPFTEESTDLFNLVTKVVMTDEVKRDLCDQSNIGKKMLETFTQERIQSDKVNLWSTMKKRKLMTWKKSGKKMKVRLQDKVVELQEDRSLFARMMMVSRSRPEIDIEEAIGKYEFTVVPRSLFASDGSMLHCSLKSALMGILEKLNTEAITAPRNPQVQSTTQATIHGSLNTATSRKKVAVIDGMAELQSLKKPPGIVTCSQLAEHFVSHVFNKYSSSDEIRLIFDRYDLPMSLKTGTRVQRQGANDPLYYHVTDSTHIAKVQMKKLLSHTKTKQELTVYLSKKSLEYAEKNGICFVVSWGCQCCATNQQTEHLQSDQEEADTKMVLHALDATANGATELNIHSPDTDVFILVIRRYSELCQNAFFVTGSGQRHRRIELKPIFQALGPTKAAALPSFHAFTGADNTGSFSGKGKVACWKAFNQANEDVLLAFVQLGTTEYPTSDTVNGIEKFVCHLYQQNTRICKVAELRWHLFKKKQAQSEKLPPTQGALHEAILRSHYQAMIWNNDRIPNPILPSPESYGWAKEDDRWMPVMTKVPPAPKAIIELVKCCCSKERCSTNRCQCRKAGLTCTELCSCSETDDLCENVQDEDFDDYEEEREDNSEDDAIESEDVDDEDTNT